MPLIAEEENYNENSYFLAFYALLSRFFPNLCHKQASFALNLKSLCFLFPKYYIRSRHSKCFISFENL